MVAFGFALIVAGLVLSNIFKPSTYYNTWKDVFPLMFFVGCTIFFMGLTKWLWENLP